MVLDISSSTSTTHNPLTDYNGNSGHQPQRDEGRLELSLAQRVYHDVLAAVLEEKATGPITYTLGSSSDVTIQFLPPESGETRVANRHLTVSFMPSQPQARYTIKELRNTGAPTYGTYYRHSADTNEAYYRFGDEPIEGLWPGDMVLAGNQMFRLPEFPTVDKINDERKRRENLKQLIAAAEERQREEEERIRRE